MRRAPSLLALFVASSFVLASSPRPACAQTKGVQPVPYTASAPVPYAPATKAGDPAPAGDDVVHLKDGGMIRGTLVEAIPKDHATVQLATGQSAIIRWDLIDHIERGAPAAVVGGVKGAVEEEGRPAAYVHVESTEQVALERRDPGGEWQYACNAPCDRSLDLGPEYRITGAGVRNSGAFHIAARPGERVVVQVSTSSKGAFVGGVVLVSTGPALMVIGLLVIAVSALSNVAQDCFNANGCTTTRNDSSTGETVGLVMLAGGAIMTVGGIVMIVSNARSHVTQEPLDAQWRGPRDDAWLRTPTWHEDPLGARMPKAAAVPLLQTTF